jgi:hypothetical protein
MSRRLVAHGKSSATLLLFLLASECRVPAERARRWRLHCQATPALNALRRDLLSASGGNSKAST